VVNEGDLPEDTVEFHLYGFLRQSTGQPRLTVPLAPGDTVRRMLQRLARHVDARFADFDSDPAQEPTVAVIVLNGRTLRIPQNLDQVLKPGDRLYLIPPIDGG
jgi:molybdopterin converting factor small subunit